MGRINSFQGSIICSGLKILSAVSQILPNSMVMGIGTILGALAYHFGHKARRKIYANLRIAFGGRRTPEQIERIAREFFCLFACNFFELLRLPLIARQGFAPYVDVQGRAAIDEAMKQGRGLILLSMHSGNWELSNLVGSMSGYPYNMVANYLERMNKVADYLDSVRCSAGCKIINPGIGGREIIRCLQKNEIVTLVADQGGSDGMLVPFFGRQASMSTGAIRIALKYNVPICLVDIQRVKGVLHKLVVHPVNIVKSNDSKKDVQVNLEKIIAWFETQTEDHPQEYLWMYSIWKYSQHRDLVILDDGRTGHLRQSEAVASQYKQAQALVGRDVTIKTIPIKYKSELHSRCLMVISGGCFLFGVRGLQILRAFLDRQTFESLFSIHPDIVISCGSRNTPLNYWLSTDNRAMSVAILRPEMASWKSFNLVVMPEHDRKSSKVPSNVLLTKAAPNMITPDYLRRSERALLSRFSHLKTNIRPKIGVLIGGDTKNVVMMESQIRIICHQLKQAAEAFRADILLTTSRRTSPLVERLIMREFENWNQTALLVIASKNNVPEVVGGILALSDILVVSGESISMVSEAASSGKKTIVFLIDGQNMKPLDNKYSRFVDALGKEGFVISADTKGVGQAMADVFRAKRTTRLLRDQNLIFNAMKELAL